MKNLRPEDKRNAAEQQKYTQAMVEISEKMAKATLEDIAMRARADAHIAYELKGVEMLKQQGNNLHSQGKFEDAAQKYLLANNRLKSVPISKSRELQLACSLNLMSCYLKTKQYDECIKEGSKVLAYDAENVKALYRRGHAYKDLGKLEAAVTDLGKAHSISPDDETIADALREAINESLSKVGGSSSMPQGRPTFNSEHLQGPIDYSEAIGFQNFMSKVDPDILAALSDGELSPHMIKTVSDMIRGKSPEQIHKLIEMANSRDGKRSPASSSNGRKSTASSQSHVMSPDMVKNISHQIRSMPLEEIQELLEKVASLDGERYPASGTNDHKSTASFQYRGMTPHMIKTYSDRISKMSPQELENMLHVVSSIDGSTTENLSTSAANLLEQMRNQMKDPAILQREPGSSAPLFPTSSAAAQFPHFPPIYLSSLPETQRIFMQTLQLLVKDLSEGTDSVFSVLFPLVSHTLAGLKDTGYDVSNLEGLVAQAISSHDQCQILMTKPAAEIALLYHDRHRKLVANELEVIQNDIDCTNVAHQSAQDNLSLVQVRLTELQTQEKSLEEKLERLQARLQEVRAEHTVLFNKLSSSTNTLNETAKSLTCLHTRSTELSMILENVDNKSAKIAGNVLLCESIRQDMIQEYDKQFRLLLQAVYNGIQP